MRHMAKRARATASTRKRIGPVLVPLDGSRLAETAIGAAERISGRDANDMVLLSVVAPVNPAPLLQDESIPRRTLESRYSKAGRYLDAVRQRLGRRGMRARVLVRSGDPAEEIVACARAERVGLIAMSTHGRSGLRRALFGSVAEGVIRQAPVPILLVRGPRR
jgi:nucleotide-binding universal stress UspA family protein